MNLTVLLYNKYGTIQTTKSKLNENLHTETRQKTIKTQDISHDVNVTVSGIKITFQLTLENIEDFTDYTIKACDEMGCNELTVKITSAKYQAEDEELWSRLEPVIDNMEIRMYKILYDLIPNTRYYVRVLSKNAIGESHTTNVIILDRPEPPKNVSVIPFERYLLVSWFPGYNGGLQQSFFVEYQSEDDKIWRRSRPVPGYMQSEITTVLYDINPNTRYFVRVLSKNEIGESNTTTVTLVMSLGEVITTTNVPTTDASSDESAHYTEITEDDYRRTTLQENDNPIISMVNIISVENTDTASQSSEHSSASSDSNTNSSENYDDGIITPTNVTTTESSGNESAHYTEINRDDYRRTTLQENHNPIISTVNVMGVENTDTAAKSSKHSSGSSDINIDISENCDDGYEKPYTTLVVQHRADDDHIYLTTNKFFIYENSTPANAVCGRSFEFRKQDTSQIETNPYVYENDDEENANLSYIENDFDKKDNDFLPVTHRSTKQ
ncbi:unnamed protein product [Mytilus coruscus]|uniref:Fibronectin type-III domain-containing protein n=1 Tax=Mytilus coruscus TaxID=42192 RepID=A0A6J8AW55_MYTCO|nr:unnamed protein product [Mytilus coruscus]